MMMRITDSIDINEDELSIKAIYSSGPGGQHVNKNMTAVQLRFNIPACVQLPFDVQQRLIKLAGSRVNNQSELVITARRHRSQERNRREVLQRFCELLRRAAKRETPRKKRKRSVAANQTRLSEKRYQSERKLTRRKVTSLD